MPEHYDSEDDFSDVLGESTETPEQERKHVKRVAEEYSQARVFDKDARKQYSIDRSYASGDALKDWASSANLIGSFIDILVSFLYAKDPEVVALAAQNVGGVDKDSQSFAETMGIVISRLWKKARLKKACRKQVRSGLAIGPGWMKVIMTHETREDPQVRRELNDIKDNIQRLKANEKSLLDEGKDTDEVTALLQDKQMLEESLTKRLEVVHRYGLAIDFAQAEDVQVSMNVDDISDHLDGEWNAGLLYVPVSDLTRRFSRLTDEDAKKATVYHQKKPKVSKEEGSYDAASYRDNTRYVKAGERSDNSESFACIVELWDKRDNHIKTFVEGIDKWAIEPYQPNYATSRFYPWFYLGFFEVDGARHPQSLSSRLKQLQDEYSSKRSNSRLVSERSIPGVIFDNTGVTPEDARKIEGAVAQEFVGIKPAKGDDIRKLFAEKPVAKADPNIFATEPVLRDMERLSGVQEALSSAVSVQKTATEAKIQDTGFASRSAADRDVLEDMLADLAEYTAELAMQALPLDYVRRIAGQKAFWPEGIAQDDIVTLVELDIRAGSTGKPNEEQLRQSWSILLPLIEKLMQGIQQAQFMGNLPLAVAMTNLLKETMRRLDERIDVEQFIPQGLPNLQGVPGLPGMEGGDGPAAPQPPAQTSADANTLV